MMVKIIYCCLLASLIRYCSCTCFNGRFEYDKDEPTCDFNNYVDLPVTPVNIVHHPSSASQGDSLTCTIDNTGFIAWRFNGSGPYLNEQGQALESLSDWNNAVTSVLVVSNVTTAGYYECLVGNGLSRDGKQYNSITTSKRSWVNRGINDTAQLPVVTVSGNTHVTGSIQAFRHHCSTSDGNIYWYKDGVDITQYVDNGQLIYNQTDPYGIYQCCAENEAGSDCKYIRTLPNGYATSPGNLSVTAVDAYNDGRTNPKLLISWDQPSLIIGKGDTYTLVLRDASGQLSNCYEFSNTITCAEIIVKDEDYGIRCSVFLKAKEGRTHGAVSDTVSTSTLNRRYDQSNVKQLSVTCGQGVSFPSPIIPEFVYLTQLTLWTVCLHANTTQKYFHHVMRDLFSEDPYNGSYLLNLPTPPNTVCMSGGSYELDESYILTVPPVACSLPVTDYSPLSVDCHNYNLTVIWSGDEPIELTGLCFTATDETPTIINATTISSHSLLVYDHLPPDTICSLVTNTTYTAQCTAGEVSPAMAPKPTTAEPSAMHSVLPAYGWVLISLILSVILPVVIVTVLFCMVQLRRRYKLRQEKKEKHFLASVVEHQIIEHECSSVDPYTVTSAYSSISINTIVNYPYEEESMDKLFESALINTDQYISTPDSSGYGTDDYNSRCIKEYYEPDLEGYIHMVPCSNN